MRKLLKYVYRTMLPREIRGRLDAFPSFRLEKLGEEVLPSGRIVVLAPHPDDEVLGCGGTILRCRERGADVTVAFMTDGARGHGGEACPQVAGTRRDEARQAASVLGIDRLVFFDNRDGEIAVSGKTVGELRDVLAETKPEAVFLPFMTDHHRDHVVAGRIFHEACKPFEDLRCFAYSVWSPLPMSNLNVDITDVVDGKKEALGRYRSQLECYDYVEASLGLSRFYSLGGSRRGRGYSEVFITCPAPEYRRVQDIYFGG